MDLYGYNIQGKQDIARLLAKNNLRLISLRWYYTLFLAGSAALVSMAAADANHPIIYLVVLLVAYSVNIVLLVVTRSFRSRLTVQRFVLGSQLLLDLLACSAATYVQGGIDARTTVLYAIPIIASGLAFSNKLIMPVAMTSGVAYVATILSQSYISHGSVDWAKYTAPVVFYPLLFLILGRITQFLGDIEVADIREKTYNSFLSLLAHQLKHPASATKTIIDAIVHDKTATHTDQTVHYLEMLKGENENQIRFIDNLLEAAPRKSNNGHSEEVNVTRLFEQVAHKVAISHQRLSDLVKDESVDVPIKISGDPIKLRLALTNIFDNGFRHTPEDSSVHYGISYDSGVVKMVVRDSGSGMSKEQLMGILKRFNVDNLNDLESGHVGGLGLGLFVANKVLAAHNGTLEVQSKEGKGTKITIYIKGAKQ